jgi:nucleoside-diphosphate-sugar epimerase
LVQILDSKPEYTEIRVLVRNPASLDHLLSHDKLKIIEGSLEDKEAVNRSVKDIDIIFHCGAKSADWVRHVQEIVLQFVVHLFYVTCPKNCLRI